jgi:hypothetical protein
MDAADSLGDEPVIIPLTTAPAYECGALLLATLAYPLDRRARDRFWAAICTKCLDHLDRYHRDENREQPPLHLMQDREIVRGDFEQGFWVINCERLIAAKMGAPIWAGRKRELTGLIHPGLRVVGPTSKESWTAAAVDLDHPVRLSMPKRARSGRRRKPSSGNKGNIINRHWNPSLPAIHLAIALHEYIHDNIPQVEGINLGDLLTDKEALSWIIVTAAWIRHEAQACFGLPTSRLVTVWPDKVKA